MHHCLYNRYKTKGWLNMKSLNIDHFINYKYISKLTANPSQTEMVFLLSKARLDKNDYTHELYQSDGTRHHKLLNLGKTSSFVYESDKTILIPLEKSKEDKKRKKEYYSVYYRLNIETKALEKAYTFSIPVEIVDILNEHTLLVSALMTEKQYALKDLCEVDRKEALKQLKKDENYEEIDHIPFYSNGGGFTAGKHNYLMTYDINSNIFMPIHREDVEVFSRFVDKKRNKIIYSAQRINGKQAMTHQIYQYDYESYRHESLYTANDYAVHDIFVIDEKTIVRATDMKDYGMNQNPSFFSVNNDQLILLSHFDNGFGNSVGTDCRLNGSSQAEVFHHKLYFVATIDDHTELFSMTGDGKIDRLIDFDGSLDGIAMINHNVYAIAMQRQKLQELYRLNIDEGRHAQISRYNQKILRGYYIAKPKEISINYLTHTVKGFVLHPKDYDPSKIYPAIMDIHGGPKTVYGKVFYHEMQVWANMGYFVFYSNPRGSDGKGDEFADIRGKYGTIDYDDLMDFADKVLAKYPQINSKNVYLTGGSYGGFMTNWIVGKTNRFKAAATQRSIANWISFYGTSDIGYYFAKDQTDGHPNLDTEKLWEQSPLKYAMNVETPLLFIHSDKDYRCPIEQAMQYYSILKDKGLDTRFVWFKDETHELSRSGKPQGRIKRLEEITSWFEGHK